MVAAVRSAANTSPDPPSCLTHFPVTVLPSKEGSTCQPSYLKATLIGMTGEISIVHDDGQRDGRLHGYDIPITTRGEHVSLVAKAKSTKRSKPLYDEHSGLVQSSSPSPA